MRFDFVTANNSEVPHVKVYATQTDQTVCTIPIEDGDVTRAEILVEIFIFALCNDESANTLFSCE